jgi:hypothetical protein
MRRVADGMAGSNRDDFTKDTKLLLGFRANFKCSFTGCGVTLTGPSEESPRSYSNIGVAGHIHAAAAGPGARRYLAAMTPEQRRDISNAILLCGNHSRLVDSDETRYPAEFLRQMKAAHEAQVALELADGKRRLPSDFVALGPDLVFAGEIIGTTDREWRLRIDHFLFGDLATMINFSENFDHIDPYDRYVVVNALGDGRQLAAASSWQKTDDGYVVVCPVQAQFPRISAHTLPRDLALNQAHDLFAVNGDLATISGLEALPQKIGNCLSSLRGEMPFNSNFGSRIQEYFKLFRDSPWLMRLIKLDVIRLACVPYYDAIMKRSYTAFQSVLQVQSVEQLTDERNGDWLPFRFVLDIEGVGPWERDIPLFVPQRPPAATAASSV